MTTFQEHMLRKDLFETTAQHIIDAYEKAGALETNAGRTKNWFVQFSKEPITLSHGGKAPEGHIYIKCERWVGDCTEVDYLLIPMDLLDETTVERIYERAGAMAQKIVDERNAALAARRQREAEAREAEDKRKLVELAAKYPGTLRGQ